MSDNELTNLYSKSIIGASLNLLGGINMTTIINILFIVFLVGTFYSFSSSAFSQSTPPLDKPIEKPPIDQMSESGRIQERNDELRRKTNSPDSDEFHPNNPNTNPVGNHSDANPKFPGVKLHSPPGIIDD